MTESPDLRLDLRGLRCPLPVLRLEATLRAAAPGTRIELSTDDPLAKIDIPHAARQGGHECRCLIDGEVCVFEVTKAEGAP
ncbi:hypothetical protein PB2503_10004 [Parvularcula bermudensis HTCC2503]|uniref:UPF0033 domain-containing protein n=1 Tax=Parvularcula bermudensis (strain ATCC BAA-594 / HTCC2503 / KCTC 12087) TaxID=314260 RepID=E0TEW0_PARBH|nr:sulfurtransferase TusA family protein [Parvularcula bermudensis]ADM10053.1 hypothetical protein PB2503_10004 [Parvularcula bermudensis HTCC2503]